MSDEQPPRTRPAAFERASADLPPSTAYRLTLPEFEGPLDLLLHLCQTHELDILNIPIAFVAEKYCDYLDLMEGMAVEVAAEYLVMAAHLAYLKSRELVPSPEPLETSDEEDEEALDPREELIRRLLEYQKYKDAAEKLGNRPIEGRTVFLRGVPLEGGGDAGIGEHSVWKLIEHWAQTLTKAAPEHTHDVIIDRVSISERINQVIDKIEAGSGSIRFDDIVGRDLPELQFRHNVVVSLLAILELARLKVIRVLQDQASGAFMITRVDGVSMDQARVVHPTSALVDRPSEAGSEEPESAALEEASDPEPSLAGENPVAEEISRELERAALEEAIAPEPSLTVEEPAAEEEVSGGPESAVLAEASAAPPSPTVDEPADEEVTGEPESAALEEASAPQPTPVVVESAPEEGLGEPDGQT
jgi:segregation and condensation protein A